MTDTPKKQYTPHPPISEPLVSVIMPIYNERNLIEEVLRRVRIQPFNMQLVLVDDHSTDGTWEILQRLTADDPDTVLLRHEVNQGKGMAIRTGLEQAKGDIILIQDADLEYHPDQLPYLIQPIIDGYARVVFGSRFMGTIQGMQLPNRVANLLLAWTVSLLYGQKITDEATAYKVFHRDVILGMELECRRFEFCPEVTAKAMLMGERIHEVPIHYEARTWEEGKKISWIDFIEAMWVLMKYRF